MFEFAWFWIWLVLPLPLLVWRYCPSRARLAEAGLRVPDLRDFTAVAASGSPAPPRATRLFWPLLAWLLLVAAAANPRWLGEPVGVTASGRDLMLVLDLSQSMEVKDFILKDNAVDRLTALKSVASDFIRRREGDRIGLVLFGEQAYLNVPLTFDRATVERMLGEAVIGIAGRSTAIGDAIGLAAKRLRAQNAEHKTIILMTDGANTSGHVEPRRAAQLAAREGLKIYTIGIGADEMLVRQLFGTIKVNPSTDLDEATLRALADTTGGRYFRARDVSSLQEIYAELDRLEPVAREQEHFRPVHSLFIWPLAGALALAAGLLLQRAGRRR
jgi:Ca-activated chloride channel family protein